MQKTIYILTSLILFSCTSSKETPFKLDNALEQKGHVGKQKLGISKDKVETEAKVETVNEAMSYMYMK